MTMEMDWRQWVKRRKAWPMPDQEFQAVTKLPKEKRYSYFIKRVTGWQRYLWGLCSEENRWCVAGCSSQEKIVFPVWPHSRYAQAMATDNWSGAYPAPIPLLEWFEKDMPEWEQRGWLAGVFLVRRDDGLDGVVVPPRKLAEDIVEELMRYEDFDKFEQRLKRIGLMD